MGINLKLKREGIKVTSKLDTLKVNTIAINIINKLCSTFPEHSFDRSKLFELISRISMFTAKMPEDMSGAKYVINTNSIYFNEALNIEEMSNLAVHECIHCIQHSYAQSISTLKVGVSDHSTDTGIALNEAAVQLMASEANHCKKEEETYYGISIKTISPNYYPLECTLVNQITYFTGTYPLYHSTLYTDDIFKNMFILKTNKKTYEHVVKNLDKLLSLENELNYYITELQYLNNPKHIKTINNIINSTRLQITNIFFKTQNIIIENFFKNEFNSIRNAEDVSNFNKKLYKFKNIMGYSEDYTFYNEFYRQMMSLVQRKKESIEEYGEINLFEEVNRSLTIVETNKNIAYFISKFITKVKKLVKLNKGTEDNFDNY